MKNICIYCGSATGTNPEYVETARRLGTILARRGLGLVYGGGRVGLMGVIADAVLNGGGRVVGVIPEALASKEVAHDGLTELHVVADMHQRKALLARRADAFLTLPGGIGTFEEFFETLSWAALALHHKPMGVLNVAGYFDPLLALLGSRRRRTVPPEGVPRPPRRLGRSRGDRRGAGGPYAGQPPSAEDRFRVEWMMAG